MQIQKSMIYIANLSDRTTELDLRKFFENYGKVKNITIPKNQETEQMRGFAYVEFEKVTVAEIALRDTGRPFLKDRRIFVQKYKF